MPWYWFLAIALVALGLGGIGLHMLVRRLGDQGLVDYTPQPPTKKSVGSAMINFGVIYDPSLEHVIEFEQSGDLVAQGSSEPLPPRPERQEGPVGSEPVGSGPAESETVESQAVESQTGETAPGSGS